VEIVSGGRSERTYDKQELPLLFTEVNDRIQSYEHIQCENDAEAALKAQELLAASQFASAEVWQGRRLVGKWDNTGTPGPRRQTKADRST
jgi:hypothetical protein